MDFLRIIQSLEELLYEVMSWLVFYPRTLWRSMRHPIQVLRYSDRELQDAPDDQFTDLLSPPLFLLLTILLSHLIEVAFHQALPKTSTSLGKVIVSSDQNLLMLRAILFSFYPLIFAVGRLRRQNIALNRNTLRAPFFAQCYIAAPAALILGIASIMIRAAHPAVVLSGAALSLLAVGWYLRIETIWLRRQAHLSFMAALRASVSSWLLATIANSAATFLILGPNA